MCFSHKRLALSLNNNSRPVNNVNYPAVCVWLWWSIFDEYTPKQTQISGTSLNGIAQENSISQPGCTKKVYNEICSQAWYFHADHELLFIIIKYIA